MSIDCWRKTTGEKEEVGRMEGKVGGRNCGELGRGRRDSRGPVHHKGTKLP